MHKRQLRRRYFIPGKYIYVFQTVSLLSINSIETNFKNYRRTYYIIYTV